MPDETPKQDANKPEQSKHPISQFSEGEELEINGVRFKVHAIKGYRLYLDFLPSK
jgi:hypothetical protein